MRRKRKIELLPQLFEAVIGESVNVFILFADLCGSTEYKSNCRALKQPDFIWISRQLLFLKRAAGIVKKHKGTVVKTIGDEILASFEAATDPLDVLKCAIEIIQGYENIKVFEGPSKIEVKVSIDFGSTYHGAIVDRGPFDPIGLPVDRCARLNAIAKRNEILFSEEFLLVVSPKYRQKEFIAKYGCKSYKEDLKGIGQINYFSISANEPVSR